MLRNIPDNLVEWIRDPQKIMPGNAMPALGIDNRDTISPPISTPSISWMSAT
jgi:cytochrome c2